MHTWKNGTRCNDGVKVLWCCFHLICLVFEGSIPTRVGFHSENFFCDLFLFYLLFFLRNSKKEVRWEGRPRGKYMVQKYRTLLLKGTAKEL